MVSAPLGGHAHPVHRTQLGHQFSLEVLVGHGPYFVWGANIAMQKVLIGGGNVHKVQTNGAVPARGSANSCDWLPVQRFWHSPPAVIDVRRLWYIDHVE